MLWNVSLEILNSGILLKTCTHVNLSFYTHYFFEMLNSNWLLFCWLLGNFTCFFSFTDFFKMNFFEKIFQEYHQYQTVWIQIMLTFCRGLIWVQMACKSYQQTTLIVKELNLNSINIFGSKNVVCFLSQKHSTIILPSKLTLRTIPNFSHAQLS